MRAPLNAPRFRPPAEAESLILQLDAGCRHNACAFCGMYRDVPFRRRSVTEAEALIDAAAREWPDATRVFLGDGDPLRRPYDELAHLCGLLGQRLPRLARINAYATGTSIEALGDRQLTELRGLRLHTLYMGLESGDEAVLAAMHKGETAAQMVSAGRRAADAGLRMSVMVLLGLGGAEGTAEHARCSAMALNAMQPALLSLLRVVPVAGTPLMRRCREGTFAMLTEHAVVAEVRDLVRQLELRHTVLRANHTSNIVPLEARLPRDRPRLLAELDALLASRLLDRTGPGRCDAGML